MGKIIGIDLGTTKSVVAIYENDQANILSNKKGERITQSFVAKKKDGTWLVGSAAKAQVALNPENSFYGVKRLIGRKFNDPEVAKMQKLASYKIIPQPGVSAAEADAWLEIEGKAMSPVEISAKVLADLKQTAEDRLGEKVTQAVITVPAYFNDAQRKATRDAGKIAGLDVLRIINEPTSAALAYGADQKKDSTIAVYDLGGGTFDVSILKIDHDEEDGNMIEVISTVGDTFLGGENFDEIITHHFIDQINNDDSIDMTIDLNDKASVAKHAKTIQTVRAEAEKAKIALSEQDTVDVVFGFLGMDDNGMPVTGYTLSLTRTEMEDMLRPLIEKTKGPCQKALDDKGLTLADIDEVLLVGSQTRMPLVKDVVAKFYGKTPRQDIDPSEIVAAGAATQAAVLSGDVDNVLLMDVIPLSIGVKTKGDTMKFMIKRNQSIPTKVTETFFTAEDDQEDILVQVYQGERPKASDNKLLGEFTLEPLPPHAAGLEIDLNMEIDADGVLQVTAKAGGRAQSVTIKANGGLSDAEIAKMLKDAEENAERDRAYQDKKDTILNTDVLLKKAEKDSSKDYFQSATDELKAEFKAAVEELTAARETEDVPAMKTAFEKLTTVRRTISEAFLNAAAAANNNEEGTEATHDATTNEEEAATPAPKQKKNGTDGPSNG